MDAAGTPTMVAFDAEVDAVKVAFPDTIDAPGGPVVPRFARIQIGN